MSRIPFFGSIVSSNMSSVTTCLLYHGFTKEAITLPTQKILAVKWMSLSGVVNGTIDIFFDNDAGGDLDAGEHLYGLVGSTGVPVHDSVMLPDDAMRLGLPGALIKGVAGATGNVRFYCSGYLIDP